ncbi:unnamed protein product [Ectocarpus sp. 12 AP-2014]
MCKRQSTSHIPFTLDVPQQRQPERTYSMSKGLLKMSSGGQREPAGLRLGKRYRSSRFVHPLPDISVIHSSSFCSKEGGDTGAAGSYTAITICRCTIRTDSAFVHAGARDG